MWCSHTAQGAEGGSGQSDLHTRKKDFMCCLRRRNAARYFIMLSASAALLLLSILSSSSALVVNTLADGRRCSIHADDDAVAARICDRVADIAKAAIAAKGSFSMSIGSGTTVAPLADLPPHLDFSCFHIFFGNERTEGDSAGKCFAPALAGFVRKLGIPEANVHAVPPGPAEASAEAYERLLREHPAVGTCARNSLPSLDLVLLGSGADGHCASLYPDSSQVVDAADRAVVAAEGKGGVTLSIECISSARNVLLSAAKPTQATMVRQALAWSNAATNTKCPAAMITAQPDGTTEVEWLLSEASAKLLPAL